MLLNRYIVNVSPMSSIFHIFISYVEIWLMAVSRVLYSTMVGRSGVWVSLVGERWTGTHYSRNWLVTWGPEMKDDTSNSPRSRCHLQFVTEHMSYVHPYIHALRMYVSELLHCKFTPLASSIGFLLLPSISVTSRGLTNGTLYICLLITAYDSLVFTPGWV